MFLTLSRMYASSNRFCTTLNVFSLLEARNCDMERDKLGPIGIRRRRSCAVKGRPPDLGLAPAAPATAEAGLLPVLAAFVLWSSRPRVAKCVLATCCNALDRLDRFLSLTEEVVEEVVDGAEVEDSMLLPPSDAET